MSASDQWTGVIYLLIGGPVALGWGLRKLKEKRLLENIPTSKVRSAAIGLVELTGQAIPHKPQKSPMSQRDCCWWKCEVQEYRQHGKNSSWVTIHEASSLDLFHLQDETGQLWVNPARAELHVRTGTFDLNASSRAFMGPVLNSWNINDMNWFGGTQQLRVLESVIETHSPLYVIGELVSFANSVLVQAPADGPFVVSTKDEKDLVRSFYWLALLGCIGGLGLCVFGAWLAVSQRWDPLLIGGLLAAGFVVSIFGKYINFGLWRN